MTLEAKLQALVGKWTEAGDQARNKVVAWIFEGCARELEALLAERQPTQDSPMEQQLSSEPGNADASGHASPMRPGGTRTGENPDCCPPESLPYLAERQEPPQVEQAFTDGADWKRISGSAIRKAALEEAEQIVKKWNFMACSDVEGLLHEFRTAAAQPSSGTESGSK